MWWRVLQLVKTLSAYVLDCLMTTATTTMMMIMIIIIIIITSGQSNLRKGRIDATHGWCSCSQQVAQCEPPPNTFPWAHPSLNPKRHLDRFSRFCTAHGRAFVYFTMGRLNSPPPQNCQTDRRTDRQTTLYTRPVTIGRIYVRKSARGLIVIIIITSSTGTVHTSAKARLIRICDPDCIQNLTICSLAHCQPSLKISCKSVWKFLRKDGNNKQTDRQTTTKT